MTARATMASALAMVVAAGPVFLGGASTWAYDTYSLEVGATGNSAACDGAFSDSPYIFPLPMGDNCGDDLHDVHPIPIHVLA
jgi:hypothetical protein